MVQHHLAPVRVLLRRRRRRHRVLHPFQPATVLHGTGASRPLGPSTSDRLEHSIFAPLDGLNLSASKWGKITLPVVATRLKPRLWVDQVVDLTHAFPTPAPLPSPSLLNIQKKIVPLLQLDVVGVSSKSQHLAL